MKNIKLFLAVSTTLLLTAFLFFLNENSLNNNQVPNAMHQYNKEKKPFDAQSSDEKNRQGNTDASSATVSLMNAVELERQYDTLNTNELFPNLAMRLEEIQERRPNLNITASELLVQMQEPTAWQPLDKPGDTLPLSEEEINDGREFIKFNPIKIETLTVGDTLNIPIAQTLQNFDITITNVETHDDNNITWFGEISNLDIEIPHQVTITQSQGVTAGGFSTEDGHFTLRVHGDIGWIVDTGSLFKVTPGVPDYFESTRDTTNHDDHVHD